jgi:hypothetical protein
LRIPLPDQSDDHVAKLSSYADDTTGTLANWRGFAPLKQVFKDYGTASGNNLNLLKTKCYLIGPNSDENFRHLRRTEPDLKLITQAGYLKHLGVPFGSATEPFWQVLRQKFD